MTDLVAYGSIKSEWLGEVFVAQGPNGVIAVGIAQRHEDFLSRLEKRSQATPIRDHKALSETLNQFKEYLAGTRSKFDVKIDWSGVSAFQRAVLEASETVDPGSVTTYGHIARRIGRPGAAQAVGQALAHNPFPILLPCHRVVGANGSMRGYGGKEGVETKVSLLRHEKALTA